MTRKYLPTRAWPPAVSITFTIRVLVQLQEVSVLLSRKPLMATLSGTGAVFLLLSSACTDLTEVPSSSITPENFYRNETEAIGGLASVYAQMRNNNGGIGSYY